MNNKELNLENFEKILYKDLISIENVKSNLNGEVKKKTISEKALVRRKRKTVMLCKKHHNLMHKKGVFITSNS